MSKLLWDKGGNTVDDEIQAYSAGEDVLLDRELFAFDIEASKAHVGGLQRIGVLAEAESDALRTELDRLLAAFRAGAFVLDDRFEDGHSAIEMVLTERLGDVGKKVHTGRSRNDQVLVATRLYMKSALAQLEAACVEVASIALDRAEPSMLLPMPGYTHLQRAVPSSVGLWFAAFAEAFIDNAGLARAISTWIDANPLGTAAGYGANLALDRAFTTAELGFGRMQVNPIYAQNSRGKFELETLGCYAQALLDVRRLAWDLSLFTTSEFAFVVLPDAFTTGSSIMPNKRNPDIVELLRAAYPVISGARVELEALLSLPSGYQRDLQNTKPPLIRATRHALATMRLLPKLLAELGFDEDRMRASISPDMYATDIAFELAASGVPFREAYVQAARAVDGSQPRDPAQSLVERTSPGAPGAPMLDELRARLNVLRA